MTADATDQPAPSPQDERFRILKSLLPISAVLFIAYFVIGFAMPVLPLFVHDDLGLSAFVVGIVASAQSAAALVSRFWAGMQTDARGPKHAVVAGLATVALSGLAYLASMQLGAWPQASLAALLLGRLLLGVGQSFIVMGSLSWGLALAGPAHTGKIMAWLGIALYAAVAIAAPIGSALYSAYGFTAIALVTVLVPAATYALVAPLEPIPPVPQPRAKFAPVAGAVWLPGMGLALGCVGFGAISTFIALHFAERSWNNAWLAFSLLSVAFIFGRVTCGHLPDRIGGAKVALVCILFETLGQALIWLAPYPALAFLGVACTGFGYALIYPGLGVEAIRRAPVHNRGFAMGAYTAFYDLSLGLSGPALGLVATHGGIASVYLVSALAALGAAAVAAWLLYRPRKE